MGKYFHEKYSTSIFAYLKNYVKSVPIRSFAGLYFPVFGLNTDRYGESPRIQSECEKIKTRKIPNTDILHAVIIVNFLLLAFDTLSDFQQYPEDTDV